MFWNFKNNCYKPLLFFHYRKKIFFPIKIKLENNELGISYCRKKKGGMTDKATLHEPLLSSSSSSSSSFNDNFAQQPQEQQQQQQPQDNSQFGFDATSYNGFDENIYYKTQEDSFDSKRNKDGPFYCCCCFSCN